MDSHALLPVSADTSSWSEYGSGENQQGGEQSGCGGGGGSDEFWYLGRTQCFRANVAYSLFGVKKGQSTDSPCSSSQYINSFFTTGGIESFGDNVGVAYANYGVSTTCTATFSGAEGDQAQGGDRDHNQLYFPDYTSTTLGCSASGQFINATFQGAYCDGNHFLSNAGEFTDLNNDLGSLGCYQVYDSAGNDFASNLLQDSASCSHTEYPTRCPDPYGVKRSRDQKLFKYAQSHYRAVPLIMPIMSTILLIGAVVLYCMANGIRDSAKRRALESATGDSEPLSIYEKFSMSFQRATTDLSHRTRTFTEKLAEYAEAEEEDDIAPEGSYEAPQTEEAVIKLAAESEEPAADGSCQPSTVSRQASASSVKSVQREKDPSVAPSDSAPSVVPSTSAPSVVPSASAPSVVPSASVPSVVPSASIPSVVPSTSAVSGSASVHSPAEPDEADQTEVANAMLAEKGVTPKVDSSVVNEETGKRYKRPRLAKLSKWIRGRFGRKKATKK